MAKAPTNWHKEVTERNRQLEKVGLEGDSSSSYPSSKSWPKSTPVLATTHRTCWTSTEPVMVKGSLSRYCLVTHQSSSHKDRVLESVDVDD
ncbi:hypothetical protein EUGRSUZ_F03581 [Eucalyptus grandis]|uniref:Uncharacterized protein n=2 Tax=Eucalyptus grandis TaxID=71139 RepID=A0ACC3KP74_EUCGR|nr:hypothetical protein EUGRSUZ_F03581 [Eucalyptus grandis]